MSPPDPQPPPPPTEAIQPPAEADEDYEEAEQLAPVEQYYERPWLYPLQSAAIFDPHRIAVIEASTKAGKAQPVGALLYTPTGPIRMGDVRLGQEILTPRQPARVKAIHPQGEREILRVSFCDGSIVEVDADHLWEVHQFNQRPCLLTTEQLQAMPPARRRRCWVPEIEPAKFDNQAVPIAPYLLGALIGDGGLSSEVVRFSCAAADTEITAAVRELLPDGHVLRHTGGPDWHITAGASAAARRENGEHLRSQLTLLGLTGKRSDEKFIPNCYRYNSLQVRLGVLQGIFDTDGYVDKHGQPAIEQTSERLARDIEEMVQSLGGSVLTRLRAINGYRAADGRFVTCKPVWRQVIRLRNGAQLFRLQRKLALCRPKRKTGHRFFRAIEFSRRAQAQCIEIDDKHQLYLTNGFIPTHNTVGCISWLVEQALTQPGPARNYWWVAPVTAQSDIAFTRCCAFLEPGAFTAIRGGSKRIILPNGNIIWFKGGDRPDTLYGDDVHAAVLDEASRMKEDAWHAVRSTLTYTRGPIRIIGNVRGRKNWAYQLARRAEAEANLPGGELAFHRIVATDAVNAGVLAAQEIEAARSIYPERVFNELYMAQASDDGGNPFGLDHIAGCIAPLSTRRPVVWGVDLAKHVDYTVAIGLDDARRVCRFERWRSPWEETVERLGALVGQTAALVDSTGVGDPIVERLQRQRRGFPDALPAPGKPLPPKWGATLPGIQGYHFTPQSKQRLMEGLAVVIQSRGTTFPDGAIRLELEQFEYTLSQTGVVRYSAPEGFHDDCVCALALAHMHYQHAPRPLRISEAALRRASVPSHAGAFFGQL
jgi:hypothetical protein